ncbi:MAG: hypothetical protein ACPLW7_05510 [Minisyncoccia bacterium]
MSKIKNEIKETDNFAEWLHQFLEVKKVYTVFSRTGNVFVGTYKGFDSDTLHFVDSNKHHIYININNIEMIMRGGDEK